MRKHTHTPTDSHTRTDLVQIVDKIRHSGLQNGVWCCCVMALSQCEDFRNQKNSVEELIESLGHKVIFLPKFHPEYNFIERYWARIKWWLRAHCVGTLNALMDVIEKACSTDVVPLTLIRKYARTSWRWMEAYRRKWSPALTTFAAKSYHGHRGVPQSMDAIIEELSNHRRRKAAERGKELLDRDREETRARARESVVDLSHVTH